MTSELATSASVEVAIHVAVLLLILVPLLAIAFPALFNLVAVTMISSSAPNSEVAQWITNQPFKPFTETKSRIRVAFATACPDDALFRSLATALQCGGP